MGKTCFIIGPIGEPGSAVRRAADDLIEYIIAPVLGDKALGYQQPIRAVPIPGPIVGDLYSIYSFNDGGFQQSAGLARKNCVL